MRIRNALMACIAATALTLAPSIRALQVEDTAKAAAKKAKKKATEGGQTTSQAGSSEATAVGKTSPPAKVVPDSEIAAAKASGKVWVNTDTGVYHKGGRWFGATKQGKFMTEDDAIKAGYRAAKTK